MSDVKRDRRSRQVVMISLLADEDKEVYRGLQDAGFTMTKLIRRLLKEEAGKQGIWKPKVDGAGI